MKISIVTPTFNSERYLSETIESVLSQCGDFSIEYIIADGRSTDKSIQIASYYKSLIEKQMFPLHCHEVAMKILSRSDHGMYEAINNGFKHTTGEVMGYINSDDFYLPGAFQATISILKNNPMIEWITGFPTIANQVGSIFKVSNAKYGYHKDFIRKGFYRDRVIYYIQQEGSFWRRTLWNKVGGKMNDSLKLAGDFELWTRFAKYADLWMVRASLAAFRKRPGQLSEQMDRYEQEIKSLRLPEPTWFEKTLLTKKYLQYFVKKIYSFPQLSYNKDLDTWAKSRKAV